MQMSQRLATPAPPLPPPAEEVQHRETPPPEGQGTPQYTQTIHPGLAQYTLRSPMALPSMGPLPPYMVLQAVYTVRQAPRPVVHHVRSRRPAVGYRRRQRRQFGNLGRSLSDVFRELVATGHLTPLAPRPPPQHPPPHYDALQHCDFHQGPGHSTNACQALRHAIQDLIDRGDV